MEMMAVDVHGGITFAQEEAGLWKDRDRLRP